VLHEALRDLKSEDCSTRAEFIPSEAVRTSAAPLACEPTRDSEPSRDLKNVDWPTRAESTPHEALMLSPRPLT